MADVSWGDVFADDKDTGGIDEDVAGGSPDSEGDSSGESETDDIVPTFVSSDSDDGALDKRKRQPKEPRMTTNKVGCAPSITNVHDLTDGPTAKDHKFL